MDFELSRGRVTLTSGTRWASRLAASSFGGSLDVDLKERLFGQHVGS